MSHPPPTPSWTRRLAKYVYFMARGNAPSACSWLAAHDAVKRNDYRGIDVAALTSAWSATGNWSDLSASAGTIRSQTLGLAFQADDLLAHGYDTLVALHQRGFAIERREDGLLISNAAFRLRLTTKEELSIVQEIFVEGCYDFRVGGSWNVLDIGANVGMASLFFASQPWVYHVNAFEPFGPTASDHATNVALNPSLAPKISLHRYGVGDRRQTLSVDYHPHLRGSMSVHGLGSWRGTAETAGTAVSIEVRAASAMLGELAPSFSDRPIFMKLDCEGSEFPILADLEQSGWLARIGLIVMETHQRRPDELVERLRRNGFSLHVRAMVPDQTQCLVLAWREPQK